MNLVTVHFNIAITRRDYYIHIVLRFTILLTTILVCKTKQLYMVYVHNYVITSTRDVHTTQASSTARGHDVITYLLLIV